MSIDSVHGTPVVPETQFVSNPPPVTSPPSPVDSSAATTSSQPQPVVPEREVDVATEENQVVYRFVDKRSGELVQQVPPEEVLRVMRNIAELQKEMTKKVNREV